MDVLLLNTHTHLLEFAAGRGFHTSFLQHTRLSLGEGYAGRAALERRIIHIPNIQLEKNSLRRAPMLSEEGLVTYHGTPLIAKGQVKGVLEVFHRKPFHPDQEWSGFLDSLAGQAAIAIDNASLFSELQRSTTELIVAYDRTLEGWSNALDLRDKETEGHTLRVTELTLQVAQSLGVSEEQLVHIRRGALLHDIGKMGVPDSILLKPGALTEEEWVIMRKHPVYAYELLSPIKYLEPALDIPHYHHEKWDGSGYPRGLKEDQIPFAARIFAIIDVWDAVRSDRPYRPAWPEEKAIDYIRSQSGKHFDPKILDAFLTMIPAMQNLKREG
jgi:putative nucleotidyltransferase with HDIG domain